MISIGRASSSGRHGARWRHYRKQVAEDANARCHLGQDGARHRKAHEGEQDDSDQLQQGVDDEARGQSTKASVAVEGALPREVGRHQGQVQERHPEYVRCRWNPKQPRQRRRRKPASGKQSEAARDQHGACRLLDRGRPFRLLREELCRGARDAAVEQQLGPGQHRDDHAIDAELGRAQATGKDHRDHQAAREENSTGHQELNGRPVRSRVLSLAWCARRRVSVPWQLTSAHGGPRWATHARLPTGRRCRRRSDMQDHHRFGRAVGRESTRRLDARRLAASREIPGSREP